MAIQTSDAKKGLQKSIVRHQNTLNNKTYELCIVGYFLRVYFGVGTNVIYKSVHRNAWAVSSKLIH